MLTLDFPGSRILINAIGAAMAKPTTHKLTDCLRNYLCKLIRDSAAATPYGASKASGMTQWKS